MRVRENVTIQDDAGGLVRYSAGDTVDEAHERFITNPNVIENDRLDALDHVGTLVLIEIARLLGIDDWASAARDGLCEQIAARDDAVDVITMVISRFVDEGRQVERVDASDTGLQVVEPAQTYPSGYDEQPEPEGEPVVIDVDLSEHAQMPGTDAPGPEAPTPTTETINVDGEQPQRSQETSPQPEQTESASLQAIPQEGVQHVSPEAAAASTPEQAIEGLKTAEDLKGFAVLNGIDVDKASKPETLRKSIVAELRRRGPSDAKRIDVGGSVDVSE